MASIWDERRRLSRLRAAGKLSAREFAEAEAMLLEAVPLVEEVAEAAAAEGQGAQGTTPLPPLSRQIAVPVGVAGLAGLLALAIPGATVSFAATVAVGVLTVIVWRLYDGSAADEE